MTRFPVDLIAALAALHHRFAELRGDEFSEYFDLWGFRIGEVNPLQLVKHMTLLVADELSVLKADITRGAHK